MLLQTKRWLPDRKIIAVGDSSYSVLDLLAALEGSVTFITRLRLDAALYEPVSARKKGQNGRPRMKGKRLATLQQVAQDTTTVWQTLVFSHWYGYEEKTMQVATGTALWYHSGKVPVAIRWVLLKDLEGKLETTALLSTDLSLTAEQVVTYFARRWAMEVTFQEVRAHLGVETQRQWSASEDERTTDKSDLGPRIRSRAIAHTTPVLLGLFSLITLMAQALHLKGKLVTKTSAWYQKQWPTFSDTIASVRQALWNTKTFSTSYFEGDMIKIPRQQLQLFQQALAWAA